MTWELTVVAVQTWPSDQFNATALAGSQSPSAASSPTTRNCWPKAHCFLSTNLTRTVPTSGAGTVNFTRRANVSLSYLSSVQTTPLCHYHEFLILRWLFALRLGLELIPSAAAAGGRRFSAETRESRSSSSPTCTKINGLHIL